MIFVILVHEGFFRKSGFQFNPLRPHDVREKTNSTWVSSNRHYLIMETFACTQFLKKAYLPKVQS